MDLTLSPRSKAATYMSKLVNANEFTVVCSGKSYLTCVPNNQSFCICLKSSLIFWCAEQTKLSPAVDFVTLH